MKPETGNLSNKVGRGLRTRRCLKHIACFAVSIALISMSGCVTLGYDFIKQQATVTFDAKTVKEPSK
jgi:hypothetical protein